MQARVLLPSVLVAAMAATAGCAASDKSTDAATNNDIVIGASLELSGATASIGTTYQKALDLKVKDLNAGGTLGSRKIRLIVRDNRTDNNTSVANINEFVQKDHVSVALMGGCSACAAAAIPALTAGRTPAIALASASSLVTPVADRKYIFKISPDPRDDADVLVNGLRAKGIHKIGLISVANVYGQEGAAAVKQAAASAGITVTDAEEFGPTDTNMSVQTGKVAATKPDAVVIWAVSPAAGLVVKGLRDAGVKAPVFLDAGAGAELYIKSAGAAAEGTNMVFPKVLAAEDIDTSTPAGQAQKAWTTEYQQANGDYSGFASFAADALQVIVDAVKSTNSTAPDTLRDAIETTKLDGVSGPLVFTAEQHSGLQPAALGILTVEQGRWRLVK